MNEAEESAASSCARTESVSGRAACDREGAKATNTSAQIKELKTSEDFIKKLLAVIWIPQNKSSNPMVKPGAIKKTGKIRRGSRRYYI